MITDLSKLHDGILKTSYSNVLLLSNDSSCVISSHDHLVFLHSLVELGLKRTHLTLDDLLHLVWQFRFDILLQSTQQERSENLM